MTDIYLLQSMVFGGWIALIIYNIRIWHEQPDKRFLLIPVILWAVYGIVFYLMVWTGIVETGGRTAILLSAVGRMVDVTIVLTGYHVLFGRGKKGMDES